MRLKKSFVLHEVSWDFPEPSLWLRETSFEAQGAKFEALGAKFRPLGARFGAPGCKFGALGAEGDNLGMSLPRKQALAKWQRFYHSKINGPGQIVSHFLPFVGKCEANEAD